jgi:AraC-like DNA-binding protein
MTQGPAHHSLVLAAPWPGVHGTVTDSVRAFGRHWHATYGLGRLERGAQRSASGRGPVEAGPGDLITTNPGEVHDGRPIDGAARRWRMVYLDAEVMQRLAAEAGLAHAGGLALTRPVLRDARLARALHHLLDRLALWSDVAEPAQLATGSPTQAAPAPATPARRALALACDEALAGTVAALLARHATGAGTDLVGKRGVGAPALQRVRDRLADDPLQAPTLAELAALAGLSRFQVLRHFAQAYGLTPHAWLQQQRLEQARRQVARGTSLAEAAAASGFADQSHMTRLFVRQFGYTPGAWQWAMNRPAARRATAIARPS